MCGLNNEALLFLPKYPIIHYNESQIIGVCRHRLHRKVYGLFDNVSALPTLPSPNIGIQTHIRKPSTTTHQRPQLVLSLNLMDDLGGPGLYTWIVIQPSFTEVSGLRNGG